MRPHPNHHPNRQARHSIPRGQNYQASSDITRSYFDHFPFQTRAILLIDILIGHPTSLDIDNVPYPSREKMKNSVLHSLLYPANPETEFVPEAPPSPLK